MRAHEQDARSVAVLRWISASALPLAALCACASTPELATPEPRHPIEVHDANQPILFEKVIVRLAAGATYGHTYNLSRPSQPPQELVHTSKHLDSEEFNILVTDRMSELGYDVVDPTDAVFTPDSTVRTRFRVVGIVTDLQIDTWRNFYDPERSYQTTELEMEVRLYDASVKGVVYENSFTGRASDVGASLTSLPTAVLNAVEGALSDPGFAAIVTAPGRRVWAVGEPIRIPACDRLETSLPGAISLVSPAVVSVRQGGLGGSGVLVSPQGHILTAAHVAKQGEVFVTLESGVELAAEVERVDESSDVALLKVPGRGYPCLALGDREGVERGTEVYAIGSPLDDRLAGSVSRGIVSGRPTLEGRDLLQTDASVNPGNSGGPLLDSRGRVLGLVTSKFYGPAVEGVGFAVPAATVREALNLDFERP